MIATLQKPHVGAFGDEYRNFWRQARAPRLRTMREFAEEEIRIPNGPFAGLKYRADRLPYCDLWFEAVDHGPWNRFCATGPTQSGKTLTCFVIPTLYHLFEIGEGVGLGVPHMDMAADKWRKDLLPVIMRSRYCDLVPAVGGGSRGGKVQAIDFKNGATLRFLTGGGSDKTIAGYTVRVLVITETDGMDEAGGRSREADRVTQLEVRTRAFSDRKRVYMECTVSIEKGRTWKEYNQGTASQILLPCPHCKKRVALEREHLRGWEDADNVVDAGEGASFFCCECGEAWSREECVAANKNGILVHRGQEVDSSGRVVGDPPKTNTLGFRWSAVNNLLQKPADIGADEWTAVRDDDEANAEKKMCQFVWAVPYVPPIIDSVPLIYRNIVKRTRELKRGVVPSTASYLTMTIDLGLNLCHWVAIAHDEDSTSHVVDYDVVETAAATVGEERGILLALRDAREIVLKGWECEGEEGRRVPDQVWVDSGGKWAGIVYAFCRESREKGKQRFRPTRGLGASQDMERVYSRPKKTGNVVVKIGEGWHASVMRTGLFLFELNADHWKSHVHQRLSMPIDERGAMSLFSAHPNDHLSFAKHLTAEKRTEEFVPGKGTIVRWEQVRKNNHWLDTCYMASACANFCGAKLIRAPKRRRRAHGSATTRDRAWVATQR